MLKWNKIIMATRHIINCGCSNFLAGVLMLLGAIIYAADVHKDLNSDFTLGAGFALVIVAAVITGSGGAPMFLIQAE